MTRIAFIFCLYFSYGFRNWSAENFIFNKNFVSPSQEELQRQLEMDRQRQLVEEAKNNLLARFPFYAINLQQQQVTENVPLPVAAPENIPIPPMNPPPPPPEGY